MQSVDELRARVERVDLWAHSTTDDRCANCRFYRVLREDVGYCLHKEVDMVVGGAWWCKLWAPDRATTAARQATASG
jgi:hypothetical protein